MTSVVSVVQNPTIFGAHGPIGPIYVIYIEIDYRQTAVVNKLVPSRLALKWRFRNLELTITTDRAREPWPVAALFRMNFALGISPNFLPI